MLTPLTEITNENSDTLDGNKLFVMKGMYSKFWSLSKLYIVSFIVN
jgi:hypothetical protein